MQAIQNTDLRKYGILALPVAVAGLPLYLHAPDYYVTEREVSLFSIGLVLLFVRSFDAIQDPVIGILSDMNRRHRGAIMLTGVLGLGIGMICLFAPPAFNGLAWFTLWVVVASTCYSVITINLNAIGGVWSEDRNERTRIAGSRERFGLIGILVGVLLPGILMIWYSKPLAFGVLAAVLGLLLVISGLLFFGWFRANREVFEKRDDIHNGIRQLVFPTGRASRRLILVSFLGALASAFPAVLFLFFVRDQLMAESLTWLFLLIYFIAGMLGIPLWRDLSGRLGKVATWCLTILLAAVSFVGAAFVAPGGELLYGLVCLATGLALGGDLVFPSSLLADYVGKDAESRAQASSAYAWLSLVQKASLGIAGGIAFSVLGLLGFTSGEENSSGALAGLVMLYAVVPLILKIACALLLWNWRQLLEGNKNNEETMDKNLYRTAVSESDTNRM